MYGDYMTRDCPPNTFLYAVRPGDTYTAIARRYGISVEGIAAANPGDDPNALSVFQLLCVPRPGAYPACPSGVYYTVQAGDTVYAIALRYGVSQSALLAANPGVDPQRLYVGQALCVPAAAAPTGCPAGSLPYVVQRGDTLYGISARYGVSLGAMLRANPGVNPQSLTVGQVLCLPSA